MNTLGVSDHTLNSINCPNCGATDRKELSGPNLYKKGTRGLHDVVKNICVHHWHNIISEPIHHDLPEKSSSPHSYLDHKQ